ncbi:hypothetical protein WA026_018964 [Henosepilachna vigintioctopunctata]|uniref:Uncharacterized protein n=1 Tax=Henosepilachna vigintioctopunctata TaxID=420089 RepID=A0AAW1UQ62_9CUCU
MEIIFIVYTFQANNNGTHLVHLVGRERSQEPGKDDRHTCNNNRPKPLVENGRMTNGAHWRSELRTDRPSERGRKNEMGRGEIVERTDQ